MLEFSCLCGKPIEVGALGRHDRCASRLTTLRNSQCPELRIPRLAIRADQHSGGFRIADDVFLLGIPAKLAARPQRNIREVTDRCHAMSAFQLRARLLPGLDAVEKVSNVKDVLLSRIA